eukprot:scaffold6971_cov148-Skeletonema_marinoi.AAC.2
MEATTCIFNADPAVVVLLITHSSCADSSNTSHSSDAGAQTRQPSIGGLIRDRGSVIEGVRGMGDFFDY